MADHKRAYATGDTDGTSFLDPFVTAENAVDQSGEVFKGKIIEAIRAVH